MADLEERVRQVIAHRAIHFERYPESDNGISQDSQEYARLRTFLKRITELEDASKPLQIDAAEVPLSFEDELFQGEFILHHCCSCNRINPPELTFVRPFYEEDGMRYYGEERHCLCGAVIAANLKGHRRP